jgi:hypothetical protein
MITLSFLDHLTSLNNTKLPFFQYIYDCVAASVVYRSEFLATDAEVRFPELQDFLRSSGSGTGSIQPREYN